VWNILEGQFEIVLVNAQHIKAVPGRKTDQKDSECTADLLQHGLLRGTFVPPRGTRELRDLTRYRERLTEECNRIANRNTEGSGRCQHQAGFGDDGCVGRLRTRHDPGDHRW